MLLTARGKRKRLEALKRKRRRAKDPTFEEQEREDQCELTEEDFSNFSACTPVF